ncbi:MAG: acyl-CoA dehydrogenase family protein [Novosphingobium sp.]|nr:acyl-CoA dehydrogenase family protein [Novosphingobium sp.]
MYLAPDGDEIEIANAAAGFLAEVMPIERLHKPGSSDLQAGLRRQLGKMGWFALAVPESDGGSGLTAVEHALFFREAGRQCAPVDLISQCLAANTCPDADLRAAIIAGDVGVALLIAQNDGWRMLGAQDAEYALHVDAEAARLFAMTGRESDVRPPLDIANSITVLPELGESLSGSEGPQIWRLGQLASAAMLVGAAEAALDLIVDYAKVREAFGKPIGAFQAVRHPCANMAVRLEAARAQLWYAAAAIKEGRTDAPVHLETAKHLANQAAMEGADSTIQLHGGIGVTDEHNAHLLLKHALVLSRLFGSRRSLLTGLLHARLED